MTPARPLGPVPMPNPGVDLEGLLRNTPPSRSTSASREPSGTDAEAAVEADDATSWLELYCEARNKGQDDRAALLTAARASDEPWESMLRAPNKHVETQAAAAGTRAECAELAKRANDWRSLLAEAAAEV